MSIHKVFITGATGYIGGSVAALLLKKGYQVSALVRKQEDAEKLKALGMTPILGAIHDMPVLRKAAAQADAVIHTADADDVYSVVTFLKELAGTGKTFIFTSGSSLVGDDAKGEKSDIVYSEDIPVQPKLEKLHRVALNDHILATAKAQVRTIVIVPTMVYGTGTGIKPDSIQVPMLIDISKEKQAGIYIEKGENKWSNVHIQDLAALYVLALENAQAGSYFYAENGNSSLKDIAVSISKMLGFEGKSQSISLDHAVKKWGPDAAGYGFASNSLVNADKAKKLLGWLPKYHSILEDIEHGSYKSIHTKNKEI